MMYWIIFALFTTVEVFTDIFLNWVPFYYELKIAFVVWLLSPYTKGSSVLYRKFVHPTLSSKEKDIDDYLCQAKDKSYDTLVHFGRKGLNVAATAAVMAAAKGQGVLSERLRSFSMQDLSSLQADAHGNPQASVTTQPSSGQHRARSMMRSKSESGYSKGQDYPLTDFALLNLEQSDCVKPDSPLTPPPPPASTQSPPLPDPSLDAPESPAPNPSPQLCPAATGGVEEKGPGGGTGSPQLRLLKRRAPEPPPRALRPITRSRSKNSLTSSSEVM